jgi:hypothetical protein
MRVRTATGATERDESVVAPELELPVAAARAPHARLPPLVLGDHEPVRRGFVAKLRRERSAQDELAPAEAHRDRVLADAEPRGDLGVRRVVDVAVHEHVPRRRRQQREGAVEQVDELRPLELHLDVELVRHLDLIADEHDAGVSAARARPAAADVPGDRREPAVGACLVVKLVPVSPGLEQRLLGQVFGGRAVAGDGGAQAHQAAPFRLAPQIHVHQLSHAMPP